MPSARRSPRSAAKSTYLCRCPILPRDKALADAKQQATDRAVAAGAAVDTVEIVEVEEVPLAYLPSNATRIRVKAVGDLARG